jgi:cysteinyl-tRNA synthetase
LDKWQFSQVPVGQAADLSPASPIIMRQKVVMIDQVEEADTPEPMVSAAKPKSDLSDTQVQLKVDERNEARKQKDFKKADEIRRFLSSHGIVIEDKPDGTSRWKR